MFWSPLVLMGLAIALWRFTQTHTDDISRLLSSLSALICLLTGLIIAPLPLKTGLLLGLLIFPTCASSGDRWLKPTCPRLCLLRRHCRPLAKETCPAPPR